MSCKIEYPVIKIDCAEFTYPYDLNNEQLRQSVLQKQPKWTVCCFRGRTEMELNALITKLFAKVALKEIQNHYGQVSAVEDSDKVLNFRLEYVTSVLTACEKLPKKKSAALNKVINSLQADLAHSYGEIISKDLEKRKIQGFATVTDATSTIFDAQSLAAVAKLKSGRRSKNLARVVPMMEIVAMPAIAERELEECELEDF